MRYQITERRDANNPANDDPKAQAFPRHSGVFDIRDTQSGNVICGSSSKLPELRKTQARWNSATLAA